jgi:hypothetical protein
MPGVPVMAPAVIPAKAGIPGSERRLRSSPAGAPACAGATISSPRAGGESRAWLPSARRLAGEDEAARASAAPHRRALHRALISPAFCLAPLLLLAACAATQSGAAVQPHAPGFLYGVWHGFIFPIAWIVSLFMPDVGVYAVPNNGGWYDFGYFVGIVFLGVGARQARRN